MLSLFSFSLWLRKAWTLIRKTQNYIITLDETKEDNPVVRLGYFIIELSYSCLLTLHCVHSVQETPYVSLKLMSSNGHMNQMTSHGSKCVKHQPCRGSPQSGPTSAMCGSTAEKTKQINKVSIHCLFHHGLWWKLYTDIVLIRLKVLLAPFGGRKKYSNCQMARRI